MVRFSRGLLMILVIIVLISCGQAATVYGTIYSWSDFEKPLKNAIIEIDTMPARSRLATDVTYAFDALLLFPLTDPEFEYLGDINLSSDMAIKGESNLNSYIILLFL